MADVYPGRASRSPDRWDEPRSPASDRWRRRSRSPDRYPERRDRDRRYAATPSNIDRYVPHDRPQELRDPMMLDAQVGFAHFADWWRKVEGRRDRDTEKELIQAAYDVYKERFAEKAAKAFVAAHKNEEWFKERYDPAVAPLVDAKIARYRKTLFPAWEQQLKDGIFDDFTLEGVNKDNADKEDGEETSEFQAVHDLVPMPGGDLRDESADEPTLLIKTIAPGVSRQELEDLCIKYLGQGSGGYQWLSLSESNPSKRYHRIGWVMLRPGTAERQFRDEEMPDADEDVAGKAMEALNEKTIHSETRGDFTCHVGVHTPLKDLKKKALWDLFSVPERIEKDLGLVEALARKFDADLGVSGVDAIERRVEQLNDQGRLDDELAIHKKKLDLTVEYLRRVFHFCFFCVHGSDSAHELARKCTNGHLRRPSTLTKAAREAAIASVRGDPLPKSEPAEDGEVEERSRKRADMSKADQQLARAFGWVKTFEEKLKAILEPESVDLRRVGGRPIEEAVDEEVSRHVKQEDESKWRCRVPECSKLFKGQDFWRMHVEKRHDAWVEGLRRDAALINAYALDPNRLTPSKDQSNGHSARNGNSQPGPVRRRDQVNRRPGPYDRGRKPQAVLGRSLKSYEDLDGRKREELDY